MSRSHPFLSERVSKQTSLLASIERYVRIHRIVSLALQISRNSELGPLHLCQQFDELLLSFGLVVAALGVCHLRDVHRTELRLFVEIIRQILIVHCARSRRIERKLKLFVPIKQESRIAQRVIPVSRA